VHLGVIGRFPDLQLHPAHQSTNVESGALTLLLGVGSVEITLASGRACAERKSAEAIATAASATNKQRSLMPCGEGELDSFQRIGQPESILVIGHLFAR